jgi:hypothetical protein
MNGRARAARFRELARRRLWSTWETEASEDERTPDERRQENEEQ